MFGSDATETRPGGAAAAHPRPRARAPQRAQQAERRRLAEALQEDIGGADRHPSRANGPVGQREPGDQLSTLALSIGARSPPAGTPGRGRAVSMALAMAASMGRARPISASSQATIAVAYPGRPRRKQRSLSERRDARFQQRATWAAGPPVRRSRRPGPNGQSEFTVRAAPAATPGVRCSERNARARRSATGLRRRQGGRSATKPETVQLPDRMASTTTGPRLHPGEAGRHPCPGCAPARRRGGR